VTLRTLRKMPIAGLKHHLLMTLAIKIYL